MSHIKLSLKIILSTFIFFCLSTPSLGQTREVLISEILPNPVGTDSSGEYIEIYNNSTESISILNVILDDKNITLVENETDHLIEPGEIGIIHDDNFDIKTNYHGNYIRGVVTSTSFSNSGDIITIKDQNENILDILEYDNSLEGVPIVRPNLQCKTLANSSTNLPTIGEIEDSDDYSDTIYKFKDCLNIEVNNNNVWTSKLQVIDQGNIRIKYNYPESLFNISDSYWIIGGTSYNTQEVLLPSTPGTEHIAELQISYDSDQIFLLSDIRFNNFETEIIPTPTPIPPPNLNTIIISEIFPNPDTGEEWIELYNFGEEEINLQNWKIKDISSTLKSFYDNTIEPSSYLIIEGNDLPISLNNSGDTVSLYDSNTSLIDKVNYSETEKDLSWALFEDGIKLTSSPTKESENLYTSITSTADTNSSSNSSTSSSPSSNSVSNNNSSTILIRTAKSMVLGDTVKVSGVLTVDNNILGTNTFYIQDSTSGIKIKLDFKLQNESIKENSQVEILGKLSESVGEKYIKVENENNIKAINTTDTISTSTMILENHPLEYYEGMLITLEGNIESSSGDNFYLEDENLIYKISILKNTNINSLKKEKGDKATVSGILSQYKTSSTSGEGYRLLPRDINDITIKPKLENNLIILNAENDEKQILESETSSNSYIKNTNSSLSNQVLGEFSFNEERNNLNIKYKPIKNYSNKEKLKIENKINKKEGDSESETDTVETAKFSSMAILSIFGLWEMPTTKTAVSFVLKNWKKIKFEV